MDIIFSPETSVAGGDYTEIEWTIPDTQGQPIAKVGFECDGAPGILYLDYLTWSGAPKMTLTRPFGSNKPWEPPLVWRQAWVDAMDLWEAGWPEPYRLVQNQGRGLIMQGTREWDDYQVEATLIPWLVDAGGIAARVQGLKRFYTLQLAAGNKVRLLKALDGDTILAERDFKWQYHNSYTLKMQVSSNRVTAWINNELQFDLFDEDLPLLCGGVAYVVDQGHITSQAMSVKPVVTLNHPRSPTHIPE